MLISLKTRAGKCVCGKIGVILTKNLMLLCTFLIVCIIQLLSPTRLWLPHFPIITHSPCLQYWCEVKLGEGAGWPLSQLSNSATRLEIRYLLCLAWWIPKSFIAACRKDSNKTELLTQKPHTTVTGVFSLMTRLVFLNCFRLTGLRLYWCHFWGQWFHQHFKITWKQPKRLNMLWSCSTYLTVKGT